MIFFMLAPVQVLQILRLSVPTHVVCVGFSSGDLFNKPQLIKMCRNGEHMRTIVLYV